MGPVDLVSFGEPLMGFYPPPGRSMTEDVPVVKTWGGDTSNVALAAARLGLASAFLCRVGDDVFGRSFIDLWKGRGVDTRLVQTDREKRTGLYFISFEKEKHVFTYYRDDSAARRISFEEIDLNILRGARVLHLSGISLAIGENARTTARRLMAFAKEAGIQVSLDVNYRPPLWPPGEARQVIQEAARSFVHVLEVTDDELRLLGWDVPPEKVPEVLPGPTIHVVKQGHRGAYIAGPGEGFHVPAFPVEVQDTVGAGDAFDAGFLAALLEGRSLREAGAFAAATAAIVCTGVGPLQRQPGRDEVEDFLRERG